MDKDTYMEVNNMNILSERSTMTKSELLVLSFITLLGFGFIDILWILVLRTQKNILGGMFFTC